MTTLYEGAFAKLNLTLDVLGKRDDGYHDLKSVMQTISIRDDIEMVGSDVPFCTICGTAMAEGRGERLRKLPDMPDCIFVVCKPEFSVSTPELYRKIDEVAIANRPDNQAMESALLAGDLLKVCHNLVNVFDPVVTEDHVELNYIKSIFHNYGAAGYQMTGSGSAVFAVVSEFEVAAVICNMLKENYPQVYIAKPV